MRVRHVQVENFRAFESGEMRLPGNGLVLVAGPNNAGKTALLSAFDVITGDNGDVTSLRHSGSEEPARLRATFDLDEAERTAILEKTTGAWALLNAGVLSSLQFVYEQWADQGLKIREVLGSWARLGLQPLARMRSDPPGDPYTYEVIRAFHQGDGRETQPGEVFDVSSEALRGLAAVSGFRSTGDKDLRLVVHD